MHPQNFQLAETISEASQPDFTRSRAAAHPRSIPVAPDLPPPPPFSSHVFSPLHGDREPRRMIPAPRRRPFENRNRRIPDRPCSACPDVSTAAAWDYSVVSKHYRSHRFAAAALRRELPQFFLPDVLPTTEKGRFPYHLYVDQDPGAQRLNYCTWREAKRHII